MVTRPYVIVPPYVLAELTRREGSEAAARQALAVAFGAEVAVLLPNRPPRRLRAKWSAGAPRLAKGIRIAIRRRKARVRRARS